MPKRYVVVALIALALGVGVFLDTLFRSNAWQQRERTRTDLEEIRLENEQAQREVNEARKQIDAMRNRPEVRERAARHELGYVRPGELVLELGTTEE